MTTAFSLFDGYMCGMILLSLLVMLDAWSGKVRMVLRCAYGIIGGSAVTNHDLSDVTLSAIGTVVKSRYIRAVGARGTRYTGIIRAYFSNSLSRTTRRAALIAQLHFIMLTHFSHSKLQ